MSCYSNFFLQLCLQSVDVALYYDVDQKALDFEFVKSMCKAREKISHATFQFYPGVSTKVRIFFAQVV